MIQTTLDDYARLSRRTDPATSLEAGAIVGEQLGKIQRVGGDVRAAVGQ